MPKRMNGSEFWKKLQQLDFKQTEFAKTIHKTDRAIRAWIADKYPVPTEVAMLINLMIATKSTKKDLRTKLALKT